MQRSRVAWTIGAFAAASIVAARSEAQVQLPRFVPNVQEQFTALSERPEAMGFELHGPDPSACRHFQGIVRTDSADGTPYLIVSRSGILPPVLDCPYQLGGDGSPVSALYIVRMGSRDKNGERLRSNRLQRDRRTTSTPPDPRDTVVRWIAYDGTEAENYGHPGGMHLVGNVLVLTLEKPQSPGVPKTMIQFLDVTNPENPVVMSRFEPKDANNEPLEAAGVVGVTPCAANQTPLCAAGHYLMVITGGNNEVLHFYTATSNDLASPALSWSLIETFEADHGLDCDFFGCVNRFSPDEVYLGENWPDYHQSLQFLREHDLNGTLYLAGAIGHFMGDDFIYLYRVDFVGSEIKLKAISTQHKISHPAGEGLLNGERIANFGAASTFHVTPSGELLFYATEHDNDGPTGSNERGTVKMGEWRHRDIVRPDSPTLAPTVSVSGPAIVNEGSSIALTALAGPPATKAWMQLYANRNYAGRNIVVDYGDRTKDDFNDFELLDPDYFPEPDPNGASDEASSIKWFAPAGYTIRANDNAFQDPADPAGTRTLMLPSEPPAIPGRHADLSDVYVAPDLNVDNAFTSAQFFPDCDGYYTAQINVIWDLNLDGIPETQSPTVSFIAQEGPALVQIPVHATHPVDHRTAVAAAAVTIQNVAPSIGALAALDAHGRTIGVDVPFVLERRPVTARATFFDPGRLDHQTASIAWGDGTVDAVFDQFNDAFGGIQGLVQDSHAYLTAGTYQLAVTVTDDDLGATAAGLEVIVRSPTQAVAEIINLLDALIASTTNPDALARLIRARKALAGDVTGFGSDGALHKLEEGQTAAALSHLENAVTDLQLAQANGAAAGTLIALLEEVAAAVSAGL